MLIPGDIYRYYDAIKDHLYQGLSEQLKNALFLHRLLVSCLKAFIPNCKNLENRVRARNEERKANEVQARLSSFQLCSHYSRENTLMTSSLTTV